MKGMAMKQLWKLVLIIATRQHAGRVFINAGAGNAGGRPQCDSCNGRHVWVKRYVHQRHG